MPVKFNIQSLPVDADGVDRLSLQPGLPVVLEAKDVAANEAPVRWLHDEDPILQMDRIEDPAAGEARQITGLKPGAATVYVLDKADKVLGKIQITVKELPATALAASVIEQRPRS